MNINFIWIGDVVPPPFIENYKTCSKLNPHHAVRLFTTKELENLAHRYGILAIYKRISLVNRINLAKYLTLFYYPGLYSDIDIIWHRGVDDLIHSPVDKFYNESFFPNYNEIHRYPEFMSCVRPYIHVYSGQKMYIFDDHLVFATSDGIKKLIDYIAEKWNKRKFHPLIKFEPFGPISITEMVFDKKLKSNMWHDPQCQAKGWFCTHISSRLWDGIAM